MTARTLAIVATLFSLPGVARSQTNSAIAEARTSILIETSAFQRDLAAKDWNALLSHFWPAKITARWEPPTEDPVWADLAPSPRPNVGSGGGGSAQPVMRCDDLLPHVGIVGRWARVLLPSCGATPTELWLLDVNGHWKIVRLVLGD